MQTLAYVDFYSEIEITIKVQKFSQCKYKKIPSSCQQRCIQESLKHLRLCAFQIPYSEKIWREFNLAQGENEIFGADLNRRR